MTTSHIKNFIGRTRKNKRAARGARTLEQLHKLSSMKQQRQITTIAVLHDDNLSKQQGIFIQRRSLQSRCSWLRQHYIFELTRWDNSKVIKIA